MLKEILIMLGGVLACGGFWTFIQFIINRKDNIKDDLKAIKKDIKTIDDKVDKYEAQGARLQILRFADELYMGKYHTREHFNEILHACESYNKYCDNHPDFENKKTELAQQQIEDIYKKCSEKHLFLDDGVTLKKEAVI